MSSTSSSIGLAILGAGIFAKEAHLPALAELTGSEHGAPKFALRAVYSRSEASAESLAASAKETLGLSEGPAVYFDVKSDKSAAPETSALAALLGREDVQGVIVVLPITLQPDVIRQALAAGKSVLSEKPVGPDVAAGVKLIDEYRATYEKKGIIWRVAENFEAEPSIRAGAKAIADGTIGDIRGFAVDVAGFVDENSKYWKTPWRTVPDYQGGFLLDGGVHFAAAIRTLLPSPLVALSGHASLNKKILAPQDTITASIRTASGAHGTFRVTFAAAHPQAGATLAAVPYIVSGSKGWLKVESGGGKWKLTVASVVKKDGDDDESPGTVEEKVEDFGPGVGVREEIGSWLKALAGQDDGLGLGNPSNTLKDVAVIQAALNSKGSEIDLVKLVG